MTPDSLKKVITVLDIDYIQSHDNDGLLTTTQKDLLEKVGGVIIMQRNISPMSYSTIGEENTLPVTITLQNEYIRYHEKLLDEIKTANSDLKIFVDLEPYYKISRLRNLITPLELPLQERINYLNPINIVNHYTNEQNIYTRFENAINNLYSHKILHHYHSMLSPCIDLISQNCKYRYQHERSIDVSYINRCTEIMLECFLNNGYMPALKHFLCTAFADDTHKDGDKIATITIQQLFDSLAIFRHGVAYYKQKIQNLEFNPGLLVMAGHMRLHITDFEGYEIKQTWQKNVLEYIHNICEKQKNHIIPNNSIISFSTLTRDLLQIICEDNNLQESKIYIITDCVLMGSAQSYMNSSAEKIEDKIQSLYQNNDYILLANDYISIQYKWNMTQNTYMVMFAKLSVIEQRELLNLINSQSAEQFLSFLYEEYVSPVIKFRFADKDKNIKVIYTKIISYKQKIDNLTFPDHLLHLIDNIKLLFSSLLARLCHYYIIHIGAL